MRISFPGPGPAYRSPDRAGRGGGVPGGAASRTGCVGEWIETGSRRPRVATGASGCFPRTAVKAPLAGRCRGNGFLWIVLRPAAVMWLSKGSTSPVLAAHSQSLRTQVGDHFSPARVSYAAGGPIGARSLAGRWIQPKIHVLKDIT